MSDENKKSDFDEKKQNEIQNSSEKNNTKKSVNNAVKKKPKIIRKHKIPSEDELEKSFEDDNEVKNMIKNNRNFIFKPNEISEDDANDSVYDQSICELDSTENLMKNVDSDNDDINI